MATVFQDREGGVNRFQLGRGTAAPVAGGGVHSGADQQVFFNGQAAEHLAPLGHHRQAHAGDILGRAACDVLACEINPAPRGRRHPGDGAQKAGFARTIWPGDEQNLAFGQGEGDVAHRR